MQEMRYKLAGKGIDAHQIDPLLEQLIEEGLLSESRFMENYIRARINRGIGPLRIRDELKQRGIREDKITESLDTSNDRWFKRAKDQWLKKFAHKPGSMKERAKQARFLQQRGYTMEQVNHVFESDGPEN